VAVPRLKTLLVTLTSLGLIVRDDAGFHNSPAAGRYLARGARAYFGDYYRLQIDRQMYPSLEHLDAGLAGSPSQLGFDSLGGISDPVEAEAFSLAQHAGSLGPALECDAAAGSNIAPCARGSAVRGWRSRSWPHRWRVPP
jgi:hypothetical protein